MQIYIHSCKNPKGHFGYGCGGGCYSPVAASDVAERTFTRYIGTGLSVHAAVESALESLKPEPHPDAGYSEPIRD